MKPHVRYEWDEAKRYSNLWRHGIDFAEVVEVFSGFIVTAIDKRYDYGERRFSTLALFKGRVVAIAHTERENGDVVRIISARWATKYEEIDYFKEIWN
jgi:uncharacterized DUF497 family protein